MNSKQFIDRVVNKMGYNPNQFTVVEGGNDFDRISDEITFGLDSGMVFLLDSCVPDTEANECAKEWNKLNDRKVITYDMDGGVSIIIKGESESVEGLNVQSLGVINSFLNNLNKVVEPVEEVEPEVENVSLKDYYRLNLPDNRIGRKSDETLIKELKDAGFSVD